MHGILFSNLKGAPIDGCSNVDEPYKQYAMRKPDIKDYIFYDFIYMKFLGKDRKHINGCLGLEAGVRIEYK